MTTRQCVTVTVLADYLGEAVACAVVKAYGGMRIKTPKRQSGVVFADLRQTLGERAAVAFVEAFGGEHVYIALNERAAHDERMADLLAMRRRGMSYAEIARVYRGPPKRYTEQHIRQLITRAEDEMSAA